MNCGHVVIGATRTYRALKQHAVGYYIGVTLTDCKYFKGVLKHLLAEVLPK